MVSRDRWGIPRVEGAGDDEVAFEQGRVTALDRTWQITLDHWRAKGTTAAVLGESGVPWDVFARRALIERSARTAYDGLTDPTRRFIDAYVDGVNQGFNEVGPVLELDGLGVRPEPWEPWVPLGIFSVNHILFSTFPGKLWRQHALATVGPEITRLFHYEGLAGSNSWAVGGDRTASGLPLIAGDPHRLFEAPNCYQQVHLVSTSSTDDGFDVTGFTLPGVPGVQHFAHAGEVAWGITNASADYQDVFIEESLEGETSTSVVEVRDGVPVEVQVILTERGPVIIGGPGEPSYSLRTPSYALADLGFEALLPLLHARTVGDVEAALEHWVEPVNNIVIADVTGTIVQRVVGRIPERPEANRWRPVPTDSSWTGWLGDLPRNEIAPDGQVVTANQRMAGFDRIGAEFARSTRADRITALLADRTDLSADDFRQLQTDALAPPTHLRTGIQEVTGWDGHLTAGSEDAGLFDAVRTLVVQRLANLDSLAPLGSWSPFGVLFDPWFSLAGKVSLAVDLLLENGELLGFDADVVVREAMEEAVGAPYVMVYGPSHGLAGVPGAPQVDLPLVAIDGGHDCVNASSSVPGTGVAYRGPCARYVWDLADRSAGGWVVPLGADGALADLHGTDQLALWADGRLAELPPGPA